MLAGLSGRQMPARASALSRSGRGTILIVLVILLIVAAAFIIVGVAVVAIGAGGELARFSPDVPPVNADIETAADVALLRPPAALWGYDKRSTDQALNAVAQSVTDRDVEIAWLRRQIAEMRGDGVAGTSGSLSQDVPPASAGWSAWERSIPQLPEDLGERGEDD